MKKISRQTLKKFTLCAINFNNVGCRNKCVFCSGVNPDKNSTGNMDGITEGWLKILAPLIKKKKLKSLLITGSDPIEYPGLIGFLEKIKKIGGINIILQSHCLAFADLNYWRKFLATINPWGILLPIYGHQASQHDAITQRQGSFKELMKVLKNFKKTGFSRIRLCVLLLKQNTPRLPDFFNFLLRLGYPFRLDLPDLTSQQRQNFAASLKSVPDLAKVRHFFYQYKKLMGKENIVHANNIPFCLAPNVKNIKFIRSFRRYGLEYYTDVFPKKSEKTNQGLAKALVCRQCFFNRQCRGIAKPYLELKLFEPRPLKNQSDFWR